MCLLKIARPSVPLSSTFEAGSLCRSSQSTPRRPRPPDSASAPPPKKRELSEPNPLAFLSCPAAGDHRAHLALAPAPFQDPRRGAPRALRVRALAGPRKPPAAKKGSLLWAFPLSEALLRPSAWFSEFLQILVGVPGRVFITTRCSRACRSPCRMEGLGIRHRPNCNDCRRQAFSEGDMSCRVISDPHLTKKPGCRQSRSAEGEKKRPLSLAP